VLQGFFVLLSSLSDRVAIQKSKATIVSWTIRKLSSLWGEGQRRTPTPLVCY